MKNKIYILIKRIISYFPKFVDDRFIEIITKYSKSNIPLGLIFNNGAKKRGFLSVGYNPRCDIRLEKDKDIHFGFSDKSIEIIEIILFIEQIENDDRMREFFREIGRILTDNGIITVKFIDWDTSLKNINTLEMFQNNIHSYLYSRRSSIINSIISVLPDCHRLIDLESLKNLTNSLGFVITHVSRDKNSVIQIINIKKDIKKVNLWKLTSTLPSEKEIIKDHPIYLFDCDSSFILKNLNDFNTKKMIGRNFLSVIGSLFFINIIPILKPEDIILFDINPLQVRYMKLLVEIINMSDNFEEFLENFFSRKYSINTDDFFSQSFDVKKYNFLRSKISDKEIFDLSIGKIARGVYKKLDNSIPIISIENNSMCQAITIVKNEYFKPGPRINVIHTRYGLAKHYSYIKKKLMNAKVITSKLESSKVINNLSFDSLIYVSNIGEDDWLKGVHSEYSGKAFEDISHDYNLSNIFRKQWIESVKGFKKFMSLSKGNFWIMDSYGNVFSKNDLMFERSDSHSWLWDKIKPKIEGKAVEVIHLKDGKWGFKEYLDTINYKKFIKTNNYYDTVILHILLGNGISIDDYVKVLSKAASISKRVVIMEHDRDSINFGVLSSPNIIDIRSLLKIVRSVNILEKSEISIEWSGASRKIDKNLYDDAPNFNRNIIMTIDL